jgi:hypothetical protein
MVGFRLELVADFVGIHRQLAEKSILGEDRMDYWVAMTAMQIQAS